MTKKKPRVAPTPVRFPRRIMRTDYLCGVIGSNYRPVVRRAVPESFLFLRLVTKIVKECRTFQYSEIHSQGGRASRMAKNSTEGDGVLLYILTTLRRLQSGLASQLRVVGTFTAEL